MADKPIPAPAETDPDLVRVVRCGSCRFSFIFTDLSGKSSILCTEIGRRGLSDRDYCSFGRRRESHGKL